MTFFSILSRFFAVVLLGRLKIAGALQDVSPTIFPPWFLTEGRVCSFSSGGEIDLGRSPQVTPRAFTDRWFSPRFFLWPKAGHFGFDPLSDLQKVGPLFSPFRKASGPALVYFVG